MRPNETTSLPAPRRMSNPISSPPRLRTKVEASMETKGVADAVSGETLRGNRASSEPPTHDESLGIPSLPSSLPSPLPSSLPSPLPLSLPSSLLIGEEAIRKLFDVYGKELERRKKQL